MISERRTLQQRSFASVDLALLANDSDSLADIGRIFIYTSLFAQKEQQARKETTKSNNRQTLTKQTGIDAS